MKKMRFPLRPVSSTEEARQMHELERKSNSNQQQNVKKKPPPRPPPPDLTKAKSKSAWALNKKDDDCLIEWSPPSSPKTSRPFGGSISSSFNSSTSSLASSKKSFESDSWASNISPWNAGLQSSSQLSVPTIIRPQPPKKLNKIHKVPTSQEPTHALWSPPSLSPPMPTIPPPSPPKESVAELVPFGLTLYNYPGQHQDDLPLQVNDIVYLLRRINDEWLYGKVGDREGMFPANFVEIKVPLPEDETLVTALYEFHPQMHGDLELMPGQKVRVLHKVSQEWLMGESNGSRGQFPSNFVDRVPNGISNL